MYKLVLAMTMLVIYLRFEQIIYLDCRSRFVQDPEGVSSNHQSGEVCSGLECSWQGHVWPHLRRKEKFWLMQGWFWRTNDLQKSHWEGRNWSRTMDSCECSMQCKQGQDPLSTTNLVVPGLWSRRIVGKVDCTHKHHLIISTKCCMVS